jgi:predicted amidohydrolase
MIVGVVQTSTEFGNAARNRKEIDNLVGTQSADLWVMPELATTGYEFRGRKEVEELAEEMPDGETGRWLQKFCADRNCHAILGFAERERERVYNSSVFMGPRGMLGRYRKLHLFDRETERFDRGDIPLHVWNIGMARVGLMICFDWRFPEVTRTLTMMGAQIVAHPSNLVLPYAQKAMVTRSLENHIFAITANRIGTEERDGRAVKFTGVSQIVGARGDVLEHAPRSTPGIIKADINPQEADDKKINRYNDLLLERRPEFYRGDDQASM